MKKSAFLLLGIIPYLGLSLPSAADSLGIHCWQQKPYNHVFCFEVNNINGKYFSLTGENIVLGEGSTYPTQGAALLDEKIGMFRLEFGQNLGGTVVYQNSATINPSDLNGQWNDDGGNAGDFQYLGTGPLSPDKLNELATRNKQRKATKKS